MIKINAFLISSFQQILNNNQILHFYGRTDSQSDFPDSTVEIQITNNYPVCFVPQNTNLLNLPVIDSKNISLTSDHKVPLKAIYFKNNIQLIRTAKLLKSKAVRVFESDIRPDERYLMERFIFGGVKICGDFIRQNNRMVFTNPDLIPEKSQSNLKVLSLDIETGIKDGLLYSIGLHFTQAQFDKRIILLNGDFKEQIDETTIISCQSEHEVLDSFNTIVNTHDPDIIIGWNVIGFDFSFLLKKSMQHKIPLSIGRDKSIPKISYLKNRHPLIDITGRVVMDGPVVLRSAFYKFKNYKLETVSQEILGIGKQIKATKDSGLEIERMYFQDKNSLLKYNIQDCILVTEIFRKTGMIELQKKRTEISGMFLDKTHRSVAAFEYCFLPGFHRNNFAANDTADIHYDKPGTGGFVMEPVVGLHENVLVLDFKSLYPSIIQTFCIDPLSRIQNHIDPIITPSGHKFSKSRHILPDFISQLLKERQKAKDHNDPHLSMAIKILMNSFYGVMGSAGCRFYHPDLSAAITGTGQWLLKESRKWLEDQDFQVLYGDTDSLFIKNPKLSPDLTHSTGITTAKKLTLFWNKKIKTDFQTDCFLEMEFEKLFIKFFLPPSRTGGGAKKRYAGILKVNGKDQLYFAGMESVRSDWSILAQKFQIELFQKFFHNQDLENWITTLIKKLKAGALDDQLTITKQLRKPLNEYINNVPQHVKAARLLNKNVRRISYKMTTRGPVPVELNPTNFDYQYYIEHQLRPIADTVLGIKNIKFSNLSGPRQLDLF